MFDIGIAGDSKASCDSLCGRIVAGNLDEEFVSPVGYWDRCEYEESWCQEVQRLVDGADKAALMTSVSDPLKSNWLRGYTIYSVGGILRLQEQMFLMEEYNQEFDPDNPSRGLGGYSAVNEDGIRVSEWIVEMGDLVRFLRQRCTQVRQCRDEFPPVHR